MRCGQIEDYEIISSPRSFDSDSFKYTQCKCGSQQPLCLGAGCIDVISLSCPQEEHEACDKISDMEYNYGEIKDIMNTSEDESTSFPDQFTTKVSSIFERSK